MIKSYCNVCPDSTHGKVRGNFKVSTYRFGVTLAAPPFWNTQFTVPLTVAFRRTLCFRARLLRLLQTRLGWATVQAQSQAQGECREPGGRAGAGRWQPCIVSKFS